MFHLHYDTRLDALADSLASMLARPDPAQLLQPQTVLVPQPGLQRWLVQRLAERHGIAANLEFLAPAQLAWRLLRAAHPDLPMQSGFDRDVLRWRILGLLDTQALTDLQLAALIAAEPAALRRFQLAGHFADLFQRYQAYRRDMLEAWERGEAPDDTQAQLWRTLVADSDEPPRSRLLADFLHDHIETDAPPPCLPLRLFAFGCINVSPDVLRLLGVLGRHCELHFLMPTPCREYWGDVPDRRDLRARLGEFGGSAFDEPANPLLVALGGVGRDFVAQLFSYDEVQPDAETEANAEEPPRGTLLKGVQADVITLQAPASERRLPQPDADDVSLQVHSCHSPLREVQVLHDRLLDLFERMPDLQPRDIAVMMPDIARYAPCVDAVFSAVGVDDPRYIPWTVADRPGDSVHAVSVLFDRLLDLPTSRLTLDDVLQVVAVPAVMRACALDAADLQRLHDWAVQAGIRWGEDEHDREALDLPPFREFSWRFGRERLLLGYLLGDDDDDDLVEGIAPLTDIEGQRAAALGQLLRVQRVLCHLRAAQRVPRTPAQWQGLLNTVLDRLLPDDEGDRDEQCARDAVRTALAALAENARAGGFAQTLDWMSVRAFVREQLNTGSGGQRFLAGGVNVCGMVPLRNVPFRVICVLGMDAQAFPRRDPADALSRLHADVLAGRRRPGDRSLRDDDRYLFLQTLMAARDVLYLSYTGTDLRDGSAREPSVVLAELVDIVTTQYFEDAKAARAALITSHPMQPFARVLFDASGTRHFTYRSEWLAAATTQLTRATPPPFADMAWPATTAPRVAFDELRRFFAAPQREFLRRQIGAALEPDALNTPDREPLVDDPMQRAAVDRRLIHLLMREDHAASDAAARQARLRAQGLLPPLALGDQTYAQAMHDVGPQAAAWRRWRDGAAAPAATPFELPLPSGRVLEGVLQSLEPNGYADWVGRANSARRWFDWWLGALVACALQDGTACIAFGRDADDLQLPLQPVMPGAQRAVQLLDELLDLRDEGMRAPLPLPPRSAWVYARLLADGKPDAYAFDKAGETWGGVHVFAGESTDPWIATALRGAAPFDLEAGPVAERFRGLTQRIYSPLWNALLGEQA